IRVYVQMETSATREYPGGVFLNPEDKALYPDYGGGSGSGGCGDDEPGDDEDGGKDEEEEDDS
nr:hypothetical protein [Tanacetum cinerariifolium]